MKKYSVLFVACLAIVAASCAKENATDEMKSGNVTGNEIVFNANAEAVKCTISEKVVNWETTDAIAVYDGTALNTFSCTSAEGTSATFAGSAAEVETYTVVYPSTAASLSESQLYVTIPSAQVVDETHNVDPAALLAVATAEPHDEISFLNKFSLVKFEIVEEGITSVSLIGNASEKITGKATLNQETLEVGKADGSKVTVTYAGGDDFPVGIYYAAIHPTTFEKGFRIVAGNDEGWKGANGTTANTVFARNSGVDFGDLSASVVWIPETITTAAQLKAWGYISDLYASGETVKLGADINYEGKEWTPAKDFKGTFDGQNHKIHNIKVTAKQVRAGFLYSLAGGTLKNVCFGSSDYDFTKGAAADAGTYDGTSEIVANYSDNAEDWVYAGPVAYTNESSTISNVVNFIPVSTTAETNAQIRLGGITGVLKGKCKIENCVNFGQIANNASGSTYNKTNSATSGICAWTDGDGNVLEGCTNYGDVVNKHPYALSIAGILGQSGGTITISGCSNYGKISYAATSASAANVGGILGINSGKTSTIIDKCTNGGAVTFDGKVTTAKQCVYLGGICGYARNSALIKGCANVNGGAIYSNWNMVKGEDVAKVHAYIGGICGAVNTVTITKSDDGTHTTNAGSIAQTVNFLGNTILGGIVGYCAGSAGTSSFSYCDNSGEVSTGKAFTYTTLVTTGHGGICGYDKSGNNYSFCTNSGKIDANASGNDQIYYVGGIVGGMGSPLSVTDCTNRGQVTLTRGKQDPSPDTFPYPSLSGGICAVFNAATATMTSCTNSGKMFNNRDNEKIPIGALIGLLLPNTTANEVTICQDCKVLAPKDGVILYTPTKTLTATGHIGLIYGKISGANTSKVNIGNVTLQSGMIIKRKNDDVVIATISTENAGEYLAGKGDAADENINFIYTVE